MSEVMNLSRKLYQLPVLEHIAKVDWPIGTQPPIVVELDPTAVCDLACPGCISEDVIAIGNSFSDIRLLEIGQEMIDCGVRAVILIGGGEPLAHRKAGELIELFGKHDVHVGITTNGSFIGRYLEPIATYAKWTRVSMDAATNDLFKMVRPTKTGGSKFVKIVENMRALAKVKQGKLGYSFLIQTPADGIGIDNIKEIYPAAELARDIGCDYFEVKPTYQFREGVNHSLTRHSEELMALASAEIERLDDLETANFKILRAINLSQSLSGVSSPQDKQYKHCPSTQLRTTVTPGGVYVCPYWRGKERMRIGNLTTQSFKEMWEGVQRERVMAKLDASVDCNFHCLRHETNKTVIDLQQRIGESAPLQGIEEFDRFI